MDWGALAGAVAWPLTALLVFFALRRQAVALLDALCVKLGQADQISIGKDGLTLISTITRQSIAGGSGAKGSARLGLPAPPKLLAPPVEDERAEFDRLVGEYGTCDIPDLAERIRVRMGLADRLGQLALTLSLDRGELSASGVEGRMVALATAVILDPRPGDLALLEDAAKRANYNFTRYRIVLALPPALTVDHGAEATRLALSVLTAAEARPNTDGNLRSLIEATRRVISPR